MGDDDFRVTPRSNAEIRELAQKLRQYFGVAKERYIDVLVCAKRPSIWTINGERALKLEVRPDAEMPYADGTTIEHEGTITIRVRQSVHYGAYMGVGRSRNTFAHEFGHAALGHATYVRGVELARRPQNNVTPKWISPFESAEHQTKVFAPAFLINDALAETAPSAEEIAIQFGISLESAEIYFEQLIERRDRQQSAIRVGKMAEEVREALMPQAPKFNYLQEPCPACGRRMLIPMGVKFLCHGCGDVSDRFQDGDTTEP